MPYDVPDQGSWMNGSARGFSSINVAGSAGNWQGYGLGVYCYFSTNSSVVADDAFTSSASGANWHDMVTVSLGGTGTIQHIVNGVGNAVNSGNTVADLTSYP